MIVLRTVSFTVCKLFRKVHSDVTKHVLKGFTVWVHSLIHSVGTITGTIHHQGLMVTGAKPMHVQNGMTPNQSITAVQQMP